MSETPSFAMAAVVAPHPAAAAAARDILIEGGNAIEAAVAALAVLSVALPQVGGAGGDAVWLVREGGARGRVRVLDARGPVCAAATLRWFRERDQATIPRLGGGAALTVPGAIAGWRAALELSRALGGRVPVPRLLEAAIGVARDGVAAPDPGLDPLPHEIEAQPGFPGAFLIEGKLPPVGTLRRSPAWGAVLTYLSLTGLDDFYQGDVGRELARDLAAVGSPIVRDDLRRFEPRWRDPLAAPTSLGSLHAPPGRAAMRALVSLGLFERLGPRPPDGMPHLHGRIEAVRRAEAMLEAAEAEGLGPDDLLAPARLEAEAETIDRRRASTGPVGPRVEEAAAWLGVIDPQGLAVSLMGSIGTPYGTGCVLAKTGLLTGNRGGRFEPDDDNGLVLRPGRRAPLEALSLIVADKAGAVNCLGASTSSLMGALGAQMIAGLGLAGSIEAPRAEPLWSDHDGGSDVAAEEGFDPSVIAALGRAGHDIHRLAPERAGEAGGLRRQASGRVEAAIDPRRGGAIAGF